MGWHVHPEDARPAAVVNTQRVSGEVVAVPTYGSVPLDASVRLVQRRLAECLPEARAADDRAAPLELSTAPADAPRCAPAQVVEGHALRAVRVEGDPTPGIAAFLDGTQRSRVAAWLHGLPIVMGTVAAVVRPSRRNPAVT